VLKKEANFLVSAFYADQEATALEIIPITRSLRKAIAMPDEASSP
jgi:hypothetical protein